MRAYLGAHWRGTVVTVRSGAHTIRVRLTDWCGCPYGRVIDLDVRAFGRLGSTSKGILMVTVTR